jgi:hypothetical protein
MHYRTMEIEDVKGDNRHKKRTPTHRQHSRHPQKATQKPRRPTDLFLPSFISHPTPPRFPIITTPRAHPITPPVHTNGWLNNLFDTLLLKCMNICGTLCEY